MEEEILFSPEFFSCFFFDHTTNKNVFFFLFS